MSLLTEAEAKEKWCPLAHASHTDPRYGFEEDPELRASRASSKTFPCIGSACMAWREVNVTVDLNKAETRGYCGAFTKPE